LLQTTITASTQSTHSASVVTIHINSPACRGYLGTLIEEKAKCVGRKKSYENQKVEFAEKRKQINLLNKISTISSGQLAINNCWSLGPEVLQEMEEKEESEQKQKEVIKFKQ
jgi:hypothetical protein